VHIRYFEAPESEMLGLLAGQHRCDICGQVARCFDLQRALTPEKLAPAALGCIACLQEGRFGFFHSTDVGDLTEDGLTWYGHPPMTRPRVFVGSSDGLTVHAAEVRPVPMPALPASAIEELRRTPDFPTWNEVSWPVHCDDFMVFLGSWQPADVAAKAQAVGMDARDLFANMVEREERVLWQEEGEWGMNFVVFRCTKCPQHRGIPDFD